MDVDIDQTALCINLLESCLANFKVKCRTQLASECLSEVKVMQTCVEQLLDLMEGAPAPISSYQTPVMNVLSLRPETPNWTIRARVVEKSEIKQWNTARTRDASGDIRCTMFDDAVDAFWRVLNIGQISKGKIRKSSQPAVYEMSLTTQSSVIPCSQLPHIPPTTPTNYFQQGNVVLPTFVPNPTFVGNMVAAALESEPQPSFDQSPYQPRFEHNLPSFEANPAFQTSVEHGPEFPTPAPVVEEPAYEIDLSSFAIRPRTSHSPSVSPHTSGVSMTSQTVSPQTSLSGSPPLASGPVSPQSSTEATSEPVSRPTSTLDEETSEPVSRQTSTALGEGASEPISPQTSTPLAAEAESWDSTSSEEEEPRKESSSSFFSASVFSRNKNSVPK